MAIYMWRDVQIPADALYFEANTAGSTIKLRYTGDVSTIYINLETSTDYGTWTDYTVGDIITLTNVGDKIYFRNKSETPTEFSKSSRYYIFDMTGSISANGDINYLLCKNSTNTLQGDYCFMNLFTGGSSLTTAPKLPATTLTESCYREMFYNCTNLTTLPELPATTLPNYCYYEMFRKCSKIKLSTTQTGEYQTAYRIPKTGTGTQASYTLDYMFYDTGGTFTSNPTINTTYYTSNQVI